MTFQSNLNSFDYTFIQNLNRISNSKIDYWDLRIGIKKGTIINFTDQKSKEITAYTTNHCGIRTFKNGGWGFYVLETLDKKAIEEAFPKAIKLAKLSESFNKNPFKIKERDPIIESYALTPKQKLDDISIEEKIQIVKNHEKIANNFSKYIKNTNTFYLDGILNSIFINSHGSFIKQNLSLARLFNVAYAKRNSLVQRSSNSVGGLGGFEIVTTEKAKEISKKSANQAVQLLDAKSPLGGIFNVIMDPKLTGTFIHEAFGHACEADKIINHSSILENKIGEKVALEDITIYDDPRMGQGKNFNLPYELYGSYFIDDEGIPAQKTTLIEEGILQNYLHNLETSSRMNTEPNGHGRASGITSKPLVRMGITILEPGDWSFEEIIENTKDGILCKDFQYGYTEPPTGNFQFKTKLSYRIQNGEIKELMRDVSLSGLTLEVLNNVTAIGKSLEYSDGTCGKNGQSVRVCDGGPFLSVKDTNVGGLN